MHGVLTSGLLRTSFGTFMKAELLEEKGICYECLSEKAQFQPAVLSKTFTQRASPYNRNIPNNRKRCGKIVDKITPICRCLLYGDRLCVKMEKTGKTSVLIVVGLNFNERRVSWILLSLVYCNKNRLKRQ